MASHPYLPTYPTAESSRPCFSQLRAPLRKADPSEEGGKGATSMAAADLGTGALFVLMDAIRQKVRERKAAELKRQLEEEAYDEKGEEQNESFRLSVGYLSVPDLVHQLVLLQKYSTYLLYQRAAKFFITILVGGFWFYVQRRIPTRRRATIICMRT